jgi:hypothetical protein
VGNTRNVLNVVQGKFSTLLIPFQNVISERTTLQNKSGEIYRQLVLKKSKESGEIEKWRNFWSKVEKFIYRISLLSGLSIEAAGVVALGKSHQSHSSPRADTADMALTALVHHWGGQASLYEHPGLHQSNPSATSSLCLTGRSWRCSFTVNAEIFSRLWPSQGGPGKVLPTYAAFPPAVGSRPGLPGLPLKKLKLAVI